MAEPVYPSPKAFHSPGEGLGYTYGNYEQREIGLVEALKPYNPTVMNVFMEHIRNPDNKLLGIVGDLNNLGVHVATYGRPHAENLVDLYNQAIRNTVSVWSTAHAEEVSAITFVPSGEEVLILASVAESTDHSGFFQTIRDESNSYMSTQQIIDIGGTSAAFGCAELPGFNDKLVTLQDALYTESDDKTAALYFGVLEDMRTELANQLDIEKFSDRLAASDNPEEYALYLRRLAWAGMLGYKSHVYATIAAISDVGLDDPRSQALFDVLKQCMPALPNVQIHESILTIANTINRPEAT